MIETSTGPPQSLRRHSEPLKAQTGSVLNAPITVRQRLIRAGNAEAKGLKGY
jgi:3-hydroxyisobutyrate dehydrogenase-like beta-hydroxyacid dehydrogenase